MATKLIPLDDGDFFIEAEIIDDGYSPISGRAKNEKNTASFSRIKPLLIRVIHSIGSAWKEINKDMLVESAEVELGLTFESEGNIFISKASTSANLVVKLKLKPKENA